MEQTQVQMQVSVEYPRPPVCGSDQCEFSFRLTEPYSIARYIACGLRCLYSRLRKVTMQEMYRRPSYYEGGACGYADGNYSDREPALRATFKRLLHRLANAPALL